MLRSLVCALLTAALIINLAVVISASKNSLPKNEALKQSYDYIIVPGCSVYGNTPSAMLKERLDIAIELYASGAAPKILMSGDHYTDPYYDEVGTMMSYAIDNGVPAEDIIPDNYGLSTYETAYRAKNVFGIKNALIVTQSYHLPRAVYDLKQFGINAFGTNCDPEQGNIDPKYAMREAVARIKDFLYCIAKPLPTYTEDAKPVTNNVNNTNERP